MQPKTTTTISDKTQQTTTPKETNNKNQLSILVIGETGSGKSTFINTLTNYFLGGSVPDNIKVAIQTKYLKATEKFKFNETDTNDRSKSQTDSCNDYTFDKDGTKFTFIDTPGLSDTRGGQQDDKNIDMISSAAEKSNSLCAIAIVINSRNGRMTINLQNAISRLRGSIPDSLIENIFIIFTNGLKHDCNFDVNSLKMSIKPTNIFYFDNSAFSGNPSDWDKQSTKAIQNQFALSFDTLDDLLEMFKNVGVVSTREFKDMRDIRFGIKQTLHKAKIDIGNLQKLQDQIAIHEAQLALSNKNKESFKNFTKKNTVSKVELVDAPYHSTICSTCNHVCHDKCGLNEVAGKGDNAFMGCFAMGGGQECRICTGKCSYTVHYHGRKTMKTVESTVEEELQDLKAKYMKSVQDANDATKNVTSVQGAKQITDAALKQMTSDIVKYCKDLKKICSGFNLVDELNITLTQMEFEAKQQTSNDARKSADEMIRVIREITDKLNKESIFKNKNNFTPVNEKDIKSRNLKNDGKDSNNGQLDKEVDCDTCGKQLSISVSVYDNSRKDCKKVECLPCRNGSGNVSNKTTTTSTTQTQKGGGELDKEVDCETCKKKMVYTISKYETLIKNGKKIQCQQCRNGASGSNHIDGASVDIVSNKTTKTNKTQKENDSNELDKKVNCEKCKKKLVYTISKYESLIKKGKKIQCLPCRNGAGGASGSDDKKSNKPKQSSSDNNKSIKPVQQNQKPKKQIENKQLNIDFVCTVCKKKNYLPKDTFESVIKKGIPLTCNDCRKK